MSDSAPLPLVPARLSSLLAVPMTALLLGLSATIAATAIVALAVRRDEDARFEHVVQVVRDRMESGLAGYVDLLLGARALFAATPEANSEAFADYVRALDLRQRFPGLQGIGFAPRVAPADAEGLVAERRASGTASFRIWPPGARDEYFPIVALEPLDARNRAAIGFDMWSDPSRRAAMISARASGDPVASARVTLVQEIDEQKQSGFLLFLAAYRPEESGRTFIGFVYSPFRIGDLFQHLLLTDPGIALAVYDGEDTRGDLLYGAPASGAPTRLQRDAVVRVAGRPWTVRFTSTAAFTSTRLRWLAPLTLATGLIGSLALFLLTRGQAHARRQAEANARELAASQERLRRLVDANIIGIVLTDLDGRVAEANDAFLGLVGYTRAEVSSGRLDTTAMTPPEHRDADRRAFEELRRLGSHRPYEKELIRKDGTVVPVLVGTAVTGSQPATGIGFIVDLTELKQAQRRLAASERLFRTMADQAPVMIWMADEGNRGTYFNRPWLEFTGRSLAQELGFGWTQGVHPDDKPGAVDHCQTHFQLRQPFTMELRLRDAAGAWRWVLDHGVPLYDGDRFAGYIGSCVDITERRHAEARDRFLAEASAVLTSTMSPNDSLDQVARLAVRRIADWCIIDLLVGDRLQRTAVAAADPADAEAASALRLLTPAPGDPAYVALDARRSQVGSIDAAGLQGMAGDSVHLALLRSLGLVSSLAAPIGARGKELGVVTFLTARSGQVLKPADQPMAEDLALRIGLAVDNAFLYQQAESTLRELAAKADDLTHSNAELEQFAYVASHDLQEPLRMVTSYLDLLRMRYDQVLDDRGRGYLTQAFDGGRRMNDLIQDLLAWSRLGRDRPQRGPCDSALALADAIENLRAQIDRAGAEVDAGGLPTVLADRIRLVQVFQNLIGNAIKFRGGEAPRVRLAAERDGHAWVFTVADNGIGIAPAYR
nr:CHASE domain-containing protein [Planctomycetota bacterium]